MAVRNDGDEEPAKQSSLRIATGISQQAIWRDEANWVSDRSRQ